MGAATTVLRTVGRYEILREIGRGGMARVYLARQTDLDRHVALKELAAFHAADPSFVQRFLRESRVTGGLSHPNIVTVHEYFEHHDVPYIAMEYLGRGSLRPLVGRLTQAQIAGVLEGLLAGLAHAERRGVVHRDLKPENVMVADGGGVKITDFGLAKALESQGTGSLTTTGAAVGTPAYMAPEQASGGRIGPWTDLYALGVIGYELLAGHVPFHDEEMAVALLLRHMNEPVPPLLSAAPEVDPGLADWIERLLAKQPEDRPAGAAQAWEELEEIVIRTQGPRWRREAPLAEITPAAAPVLDATTVSLPERLRRPRGRWVLACAALAGIGVGGAIAALSLTGGSKEPAADQPIVVLPAQAPHVTLAAAGNSLFVADPKGHVLELSPSSLATETALADPTGPRAAAVSGDRVYLADGETLTVRRTEDLAPVGAAPLRGALALAGGSGAPIAAITQRRLCEVGGGRLQACIGLAFTPSGLGSSAGGVLSVADGRHGSLHLYRRVGNRLASLGDPVPVGPAPHGAIVAYLGRLYLPIGRGIAVVDPQTRRRVRVIPLTGTPAAIWIVPFSGRLFATLPELNRVAVLDTAFPSNPPRLVEVRRPLAVSGAAEPEGAGEAVYVAGEKDSTITKLDPITGTRLASKRIGLLGKAATPVVLGSGRLEQRAREAVLTLSLARGELAAPDLVVRDRRIADGRAVLELWQGGIRARTTSVRLGPLTLHVGRRTGRLVLRIESRRGAFTRLRARLVGGTRILVTLTRRVPARPAHEQQRPIGPSSGGSTVTPSTTTKTTVAEKPKQQRPKQPQNTTTTPTTTIPTG